MRRAPAVLAAFALLASAGCAETAVVYRPQGAERPSAARMSEAEELLAAVRGHAARIDRWQQRGIRFDRPGWRMTQIQVVFANLGAVAHRPDLPWQVHYVEDASRDAVAAGGGYVYVHDGVFAGGGLVAEDDDDALAALLAHAIAHTALRHAPLDETSFSLEQEASADRLGALYMALAGYDPHAAIGLWQRAPSAAPGLIAAHPLDAERAQRAAEAVAQVLPYYTPGRLNTRWESIHAAHAPLLQTGTAAAAAGSRFARALTVPPPAVEIVSSDGYKGVRIGMSVNEASAAYGAPLEHGGGSDCSYVAPAGVRGFAFLVVDGRIARVDVHEPGPRTAEGLGVGSPEADVRRAYGGRLTLEPREGYAIRFESDGATVTAYRAGLARESDRCAERP